MAVTLADIPADRRLAQHVGAAGERRAAGHARRIALGLPVGAGIERADGDAVIGARYQLLVEVSACEDLVHQLQPLLVGSGRGSPLPGSDRFPSRCPPKLVLFWIVNWDRR